MERNSTYKKYLLVDPARFASAAAAATTTTTTQPVAKTLDENIRDILDNIELSDDEKVKRYVQVVQRHRSQLDSEQRVSALPQLRSIQEENPMSEDVIIKSISPSVWHKAHRLMQKIKLYPNELKWNSLGEIIINQTITIPGSNISDLLEDVLKAKTAIIGPTGWKEFASALHDIGVTKDLVPNIKRWRYMTQLHPASTADALAALEQQQKHQQEANYSATTMYDSPVAKRTRKRKSKQKSKDSTPVLHSTIIHAPSGSSSSDKQKQKKKQKQKQKNQSASTVKDWEAYITADDDDKDMDISEFDENYFKNLN